MSADHLRATIDAADYGPNGHTGAISVQPLSADRLRFDVAMSNHLPANQPEGMYGSRVLDIGAGVSIRADGFMVRVPDGWTVDHLHAKQYPSGRDLTPKQRVRTLELLKAMIVGWIATHAGDMAQADDIERNNAARTLEEQIARHTNALKILRRELRACENGRPYRMYPDLPTDR